MIDSVFGNLIKVCLSTLTQKSPSKNSLLVVCENSSDKGENSSGSWYKYQFALQSGLFVCKFSLS